MCGIVGGWTLQHFQQLSQRLPSMTKALSRRGPDADGHWQDAGAGIAFGHRRLAIIGLGEEGAQPMHSESGRYCLTYNGEIYNHLDIRKELEALGKTIWRGQSDTETLLAGFEQFGIEATIKRSVGMFAMAVWDREARELTLIRDRIGEKPLYYGFHDGALAFASELSALLAGSMCRPEFNTDAFALFLRYGYIPQPYSAYQGIHKLKPGSMLRLKVGNLTNQRLPEPDVYWSPEQHLQNDSVIQVDSHQHMEQLEALLECAVVGQMLSEVPLGAFLSGGIDSSTIVALMQKNSMQRVKTFTIGFSEAGFNEAEYAKAVAKHLGTEHTELYVSDADALAVVPKLSSIYSEPFADSSQIPTYLVSGLARTKVKVSLSGDAGDELFLGYGRYPTLANYWRIFSKLPLALRRILAACLTIVPMHKWDVFFRMAAPMLRKTHYAQANGWRLHKLAGILAVSGPESCYLEMMCHWGPGTALIKNTSPLPHEMTRNFPGNVSGLMKQASLRDISSYLPDDILVKVDRAAMYCSLETRTPLLDHRVVEFALGLPEGCHIRNGQSKWLLRQILNKYVPNELIDRPKMGFGVPLANWLRGPLRDWADSLLSTQSLSSVGFLEPAPIQALWRQHLENKADGHYPLWNVLMLLDWLQNQAGRETQ
jgi:asparagine synthase (glutamine-hydrolysing)